MKSNKIVELTEYYADNFDRLVKKVSYRAGGLHNAEDVVQEAFTRAVQYIDSYDSDRKPLPNWFNSILQNALKNFNQQERIQGMVKEIDRVVNLEDQVYQGQVIQKVLDYISRRRDPDKDILNHFVVLGYSYKEIAQLLDVNIHAVHHCIRQFYATVRT